MAIDEISFRVTELLKWSKHGRAGRGPVGWRDQALEPELSKIRNRVAVELRLCIEQERSCVLVAGRFFIENVPKGTKGDTALSRCIAFDLLVFPGSKRRFDRAIFLGEPLSKLHLEDS